MNELTKPYEKENYEALIKAGLTEQTLELFLKQNTNTNDNVKRFEMVTSEMALLYARKNKDYGNSFDASLDEDGLLVAKIRKGDKQRRFAQLISNDAEVKDESIRDTLLDDANYAIMTVMWMDAKAEIEQARKMVAASSYSPEEDIMLSKLTKEEYEEYIALKDAKDRLVAEQNKNTKYCEEPNNKLMVSRNEHGTTSAKKVMESIIYD